MDITIAWDICTFTIKLFISLDLYNHPSFHIVQFYRKKEDQLSNVTELEESELEMRSPGSLVWAPLIRNWEHMKNPKYKSKTILTVY